VPHQIPEVRQIVDTIKVSLYLKEQRVKCSLTQQHAANCLGITPQAISKWERGESLPDITLLPEIAQIYRTSVELILKAGNEVEVCANEHFPQILNQLINDELFEKIKNIFSKARSVSELKIPLDFFAALTAKQKDILLNFFLDMDGFADAIDDILPSLNPKQRARLIKRVALNGDTNTLETLIPFMTRDVRTEVTLITLTLGKFEFLEDIIMFLTTAQKEMVLRYFAENGLDFGILENIMPFFEKIIENYFKKD
jgi:DNA-binding XRE family transcriptional regulator